MNVSSDVDSSAVAAVSSVRFNHLEAILKRVDRARLYSSSL